MPTAQAHLKWIEVKDFTPGLWEKADWLMPASAAQELTDAYPQEGGGLRAFFKSTSLSTSGITTIGKERVIGLISRLVSTSVDRYLMTEWFDSGASPGSKSKPRLYRMDESNGASTWHQVMATAGGIEFAADDNDAPSKTSFRVFQLSNNDIYVVFVVRNTTSDAGLWRVCVADAGASQKAISISTSSITGGANPIGALAIHQQRVVLTTGAMVMWSAAGSVTFSAANFLLVDPNVEGRTIRALGTSEPSDLMALRQGPGASIIQGEIDDPTVQEMNEGVFFGSYADLGHTPYGDTIVAGDGYVYLTDGRTMNNLSSQLHARAGSADATSLGDTVYLDEFLFVGSGYVYDFRTKSWFKQTGVQGQFLALDRASGQVWGTVGTGGVSFSLAQIKPKNEENRVSTYTWKSAPIRSDDGREIKIREVQIYAKDYDSSATIAVTVNGTTHTRTLDGSTTKQSLRFLFNEHEEVLDVKVVSTAGSGANEAPSIESVRIGMNTGHLS